MCYLLLIIIIGTAVGRLCIPTVHQGSVLLIIIDGKTTGVWKATRKL